MNYIKNLILDLQIFSSNEPEQKHYLKMRKKIHKL